MTGRQQGKWLLKECENCKITFDVRKCNFDTRKYCSVSCANVQANLKRWGEPTIKHGTFSAYNRYRCRCDLCRTNWNTYVNNRNYKIKQQKEAQVQ